MMSGALMRARSACAAVAFGILLAACSESTAPVLDVTGAYDLKTINGIALPYTLVGTDGVTLTHGTLELNADSTYALSLTYAAPDGVTVQPDYGTFRMTEGRVELLDDQHRIAYTSNLTSKRLTLESRAGTYLFIR
jgi:hypothetical protein